MAPACLSACPSAAWRLPIHDHHPNWDHQSPNSLVDRQAAQAGQGRTRQDKAAANQPTWAQSISPHSQLTSTHTTTTPTHFTSYFTSFISLHLISPQRYCTLPEITSISFHQPASPLHSTPTRLQQPPSLVYIIMMHH